MSLTSLQSVGGGSNAVTTNSSTTPLNNGQVFTGQWVDVSGHSSIVVAVSTDQDGTYSVQFSPDGTNLDSTLTRYYRTNQIEPPHRFTITRRYARVVFTNDSGSNQTYFRLQTTLGDYQPLNVPLDGTVSQDYDATVVRPTDFRIETAESLRQGYTVWHKWGYNSDIDTTTDPEVVWAPGGGFTRLPTAQTLDVVSTDAADDAGSTGCTGLVIYGLDANWDEQIEVVTMDGLTPVTTTNSWVGVNRLAIFSAGSGEVNAGDINVTGTTSGTTQAQMPANEGVTQQAIFFVPRDHKALMTWLFLNVVKPTGGSEATVTVKMWVFSNVSGARYEVLRILVDTAHENNIPLLPNLPFVVGEQSIIWVEAETDQNNTAVSVRFDVLTSRDKDAV